jgi:uncharacterized membrane protein
MESLFSTILTIHITAGFTSLVLFWIPMLVKKGNNIHIKIGKLYVYAMWVVVVTAACLCLLNVYFEKWLSVGFLSFITVLTASPLWQGISILIHKKGIPKNYYLITQVFNSILFVYGIVLVIWSVYLNFQGQAILLLIFGIIGITSIFDLILSFDKAAEKAHWMLDHISGMLGSAIAAYTAFLAFGGYTLFASLYNTRFLVIFWTAPAIIGTIAISYWRKKYKRKLKLS